MASALDGLRVVEFGSGVGPSYCGKLLAGFGADVVKVEPLEGDQLRREGPFPGDAPDRERSGLFLHLCAGKRSVVLDSAGEFGELLTGADVLILSHRPSELAALGLSIDALRRDYPRLVIVSVTTFGLTGPYAEYLGGELVAYAASGYLVLTGAPDRKPIKSYGSLVEYEAGAHAALGAMAALRVRDVTGEGQLVDVSVTEAGTFLIGGVEQNAYFYGKVARRNGTRLLGFPPQHSYPSTIRPCKDGYVHCHSNNRYLDLLAALIPNPRLTEPDLLATMLGHADEIDAIMDPWLAERTRAEIVKQAQELRLPFTEVMEPGEVMADPHHRERGSFVEVEHPVAGKLLQPGAPIRLGATPWETTPAPTIGQHTRTVLREWHGAPSRANTTSRDELRKPLAGVRVIDFTNAVAGPIASFILADLGAEVIKIEAPSSRPKHAAGTAPLREGEDVPGYDRIMLFNELNHGKRSLSLDAARPEGRELLLQLVAKSDVLVQNFAPRVMGNLGLSYDRLREVNPGIILVSMPAFGLSGPHRDRISYGPGVDAMSGLSHLTGYDDGPPMKPGNFFCDQNAGVHAAFATLVALKARERTGEGQHAELAMIEGEFQLLGDAYIDYAMNGRERRRCGNDHPRWAPHDAFPCKGEDAWVAVAVEDDTQWRALCEVIGRGDLAADPRFAGAEVRRVNRSELYEVMAAWTSERTHYEAQEALQAVGVPAAAALDALELLSDPHVSARNGFEYPETPGVGPTPYPRLAFRLSETPVPIERAAPGFGEANGYVLGELLGLTPSRIAELEASGVTTREPTGGSH